MAKIHSYDDHDTVVRKYAELVKKNNPDQFTVFTNLADSDVVRVGEIAPDIVLKDAKGSKILTAIEVETSISIDNTQAEERWKPIADAVASFQLLIPKGTLARANRICKKIGIKAKLQEY